MCMCSSTHDAFTCWQDVNATMEEHPEQIAWFLNDTKAFNLMHEWFDLYQLPDEIKEVSSSLYYNRNTNISILKNCTFHNLVNIF